MAIGKYLSLEEARNHKELERFIKEHPSKGDEKQAAKHLGYAPSRWKKLSIETRIRKLLQDIFDADDSGVHVLNVMHADTETAEMHAV